MTIRQKLLSLILLASAFPLLAEENKAINSDNDRFVTVGDLHFSLALGVGEKTNPLKGGDDIPLYVVPSLRYYGENFYFDNGDLGYTFLDKGNIAVSILGHVNNENAHFSRWHPKNVFVFDAAGDSSINTTPEFDTGKDEENTSTEITIQDIRKRKWAIDAGVQINWFANESLSLTAQLLHDVNSVYQGFNGKLEAFYQPEITWSDNIVIQATAGIDWASEEMVDYYYGIDSSDTPNKASFFEGKSSINPYAKLFAAYKIDNHWKVFFSVNYKSLSNNITNSPIVEDDDIVTSFIGASYVF